MEPQSLKNEASVIYTPGDLSILECQPLFVFSLGILAHRTSEDEVRGVLHHLRNARYLGSMLPFSEGEPGSLGFVGCSYMKFEIKFYRLELGDLPKKKLPSRKRENISYQTHGKSGKSIIDSKGAV